MSETARRIRFILNVHFKNHNCLESVYLEYTPESMVQERLTRLIKMGWLKMDNYNYYIKNYLVMHLILIFYKLRLLLGLSKNIH